MKTKQSLFNRLLIGVLVIVSALLTLNPLSAYAQSSVSIVINPTPKTVEVGDIFNVTVQVVAGMQSVDGAEIHLIFDPTFLQVVTLTKGTSLPTTIIEPTFHNEFGSIDYAAGTLLGSYPFGTFDLLTITFEAQAATTGTALTFNTLQHPVTDVSFGGYSILGSVANGLVVIGGIEQYTLEVDVVGSGSVTLNPAGGTYVAGTPVELTAEAALGCEFSGWSGDLSGDANPATVTMDADKSVTATFTEIPPEQYALTVNVEGSGNVIPSGGTYVAGTTVELTAYPALDWEFSGWSGDLSGNTNPVSITMDAEKTVTATFTATGDVTILKEQSVGDSVVPDEIFSYTISVQNLFEDPVTLVIEDGLSAYVDYMAESLMISENGHEITVDDNIVFLDDALTYSTETLGYMEWLTISFQVKVEDFVEFGNIILNQAIVSVFRPDQIGPVLVKTSDLVETGVKAEVIPEPATLIFFGIGLFGLFALLRRRKRQ